MNILYISISGNTRAFAKHLAEYAEKMHAEDPVNPEVTLKEIHEIVILRKKQNHFLLSFLLI